MESALVNPKDLKQERIEYFDEDLGRNKNIKYVSAPAIIAATPPWSIAAEYGLQSADKILEINGYRLRDIMDFQYHFSQHEELTLLIKRGEEEIEIDINKSFEDELGAEFETPLFNGVRECANECLFCFIDQQPFDDTRESLHLKDDDFRLSYLHGSYVTLTNLSYSDRKRIEELRPGPLYISVHATDVEVRNRLLGRTKSIPIVDELKWLASLDIPCHTQIVLCPEHNDGEVLINTLETLYQLKDSPVVSVAIVPIGLTKYHPGKLRRFNFDELLDNVERVHAWEQKKFAEEKPKGLKPERFAFLSDEFYLMTGTPVPTRDEYGEYPQLEDGVGMTRLFLNEVDTELSKITNPKQQSQKISWVNGTIAQSLLKELACRIEEHLPGLELDPVCLNSEFWGITNVAGLLTGKDIYQGLVNYGLDKLGDTVIIPRVMLKEGTEIFLDDMSLEELSNKINKVCIPAWGAEELIKVVSN